MDTVKNPLKRGFIRAFVLFITSLCLVLSVTQYGNYQRTFQLEFQDYITNILRYTEAVIDVDDLKQCIATGQESEKYKALQSFMDHLKESIHVHYLYVIVPLNTNPTDNILNVIAAATSYERAHEAEDLAYLGQLSGDDYSPQVARTYLEAYEKGELTFFEARSRWGRDYTGLLPLYDSHHKKVAALCVDLDVHVMNQALLRHTFSMIFTMLLLGFLFAVTFLLWADLNITRPLKQLETCVVKFASKSHGQNKPSELEIQLPPIHTGNEVESLAQAIGKMSNDMRDYAGRLWEAKRELERVHTMTFQDTLTRAGNQTAYQEQILDMDQDLVKQGIFEVIMVRCLGYITLRNVYGGEKSDLYLKNCHDILRSTFPGAPIFRLQEGIFALFLVGENYERREILLDSLHAQLRERESRMDQNPWDRVQFSLGQAQYDPRYDNSAEDVCRRAAASMEKGKGLS